jgi:hypothetical protein
MSSPPTFPGDAASAELGAILRGLWAELLLAVGEQNHPWRLAHLATSGASGPCQRIVLLRGIDEAGRRLFAYTDARSPKAEQLRNDARVSWLFYHWEQKVQLQIVGPARLHHGDELSREHWVRGDVGNPREYLAPVPPGTPVAAPLALPPGPGEPHAPGSGEANFAVIVGEIERLDALFVRPSGNFRARFDWRNGAWQGTWVQP